MDNIKRIEQEGELMERYTTRHHGVAVIKDKDKLKEAMQRLAEYEDLGVDPEQIKEMDRLFTEICRELGALKNLRQQGKLEDDWNPADEPPSDDRAILVSLSNALTPVKAYYKRDNDGSGAYCFVDRKSRSLVSIGLIVNGWMDLPKRKED
jgi:hypothetical protein